MKICPVGAELNAGGRTDGHKAISRFSKFWFNYRNLFSESSKMYVFLWVIPRRLNFISRRFGTLYLFHLHRQEGE
jgi:hypothetical protein